MTLSLRPSTAPFAVACVAIAIFSAMDAVMKGQSIAIGAYSALFWRSLVASVAGAILFFGMGLRWPAWPALRLHVGRSLLTTGAILLFFWGLARTPLAIGLALTFLSPLIATFLAALVLGERVRPNALGGSVLALAGVAVVVAGRVHETHAPDALAGAGAILIGSCLYAGALVALRRQAQAAHPMEVTFLTHLVSLLALAPAAPFVAVVPGPHSIAFLTLAAALAIISTLLLTWAYARGQAQSIAPVEYTSFVWAALFGATIFGETLRLATVAGAAMIVAGCLVATRSRRTAAIPQTEAAI